MKFNVSMALDWCRCPRYFWNRNVERRSRPAPQAYEDGTFWHAEAAREIVKAPSAWDATWPSVMGGGVAGPDEARAQNPFGPGKVITIPLVYGGAQTVATFWGSEPAATQPHPTPSPNVFEDLAAEGAPANPEQSRMREWIVDNLLREMADWEVLEVECEHSMALGQHEVLGTPDGAVRNRGTGKVYSLQWKTVAGSRPLDILMDEVRISWHECAYERMIRAKYSLDATMFGGTLLGGWRKLTRKQVAEGEEPFFLMPVSRSDAEVDRALGELMAVGDAMERANEKNLVPDRKQCVSFNWRCQYFPTCHGNTPLDSDHYVSVEPRYKALGEEAAE